MQVGLVVFVLILVGVVLGVMNGETKGSVFWFWLALLTAVVMRGIGF